MPPPGLSPHRVHVSCTCISFLVCYTGSRINVSVATRPRLVLSTDHTHESPATPPEATNEEPEAPPEAPHKPRQPANT